MASECFYFQCRLHTCLGQAQVSVAERDSRLIVFGFQSNGDNRGITGLQSWLERTTDIRSPGRRFECQCPNPINAASKIGCVRSPHVVRVFGSTGFRVKH